MGGGEIDLFPSSLHFSQQTHEQITAKTCTIVVKATVYRIALGSFKL